MYTVFSSNVLLDYAVFAAFSFALTYLLTPVLVRFAHSAGITGKDVNKPGAPVTAEMGGIAILFGFISSMLLAIAFSTFFQFDFSVGAVMAGLITILLLGIFGILDDIFGIPQLFKALLPLFAAIPLIAIRAGSPVMFLPFLGPMDLGLFYLLVLVPIGIAVSSNLTNMLAGFNGLETGLGLIMFAALLALAIISGKVELGIISAAMAGALAAFLIFNWFPAKIFPGDVGTFLIGGALATSVILGNLEIAGAFLVVPHAVDFLIKLKNRFPSRQWWGELREGGGEKLYPVEGKVRGLCQLVMRQTGGITERNLVLLLLGIELFIAIGVVAALGLRLI